MHACSQHQLNWNHAQRGKCRGQTRRIHTCAVWLIVAALCSVSSLCQADTFRNGDYITAEAGVFTYGDKIINDMFGPHAELFGSANKMLSPNLSILGKVRGILGEGSSGDVDMTHVGFKAECSFVCLLAPKNSQIDPYVQAGPVFMFNRVDASSGGDTANESDSDIGFEIGGGLEIDLGPKAFADLGMIYQSVGDFDALTPNVRVGYSLSEKVTGLVTAGYALDEEDYWIRFGLGIKL